MEVGKQLDTLVAHDVMGWKRLSLQYLVWEVGDTLVTWEDSSFGPGFKPSTDMSSAMLVIEHLLSTDLCACFNLQWDHPDSPVQPKGENWFAIFIPFGSDDDWASVTAPTAPHAICLAALEAVNAKV